MKKNYEIDMCSGPLLNKMLTFAIPLMLSGILQLLFNAADIAVVGKYSGSEALAAVGSTGALINLLVNVFIGLSIGTNVLIAKFYGAKDIDSLNKTVHTSILLSLVSGIILVFVGISLAKPLLIVMETPENVIDQSTLYMRIYFSGMPVMMLYNFGSAILRAIGDTKRPLYFLVIAGIVNVLLNLFFVVILDMGVAGVALATVIAQCVSASLILMCLLRSDSLYHLDIKNLKIDKSILLQMTKIGLPAGIQGALFSVSNVLIQSSINSFGSIAMAGNTAAGNIEGFIYTSMNAIYQTSLSFTSQNFGAKEYKRINSILIKSLILVSVIGLIIGALIVIFSKNLLGIYSNDMQVIQYGVNRMQIICMTYFICGMMEVTCGSMRGLGYSLTPTLVSLTGACIFRVIWIYTIFEYNKSMLTLYISYPVSWFLTFLAHFICYLIVYKKLRKDV